MGGGDLSTTMLNCVLKNGKFHVYYSMIGLPGGSDCKESACNAGDPGLIPGLGRSPGEGNEYPLEYSCLGNPMDRGASRATVLGVAESETQLSN